jgi:cadmium resistance protein CadD (predicted permease)
MLWIGIVVFACTNIDDLFVLLALFADPTFKTRQIIAGQYLGMLSLIALSLLVASCALVIPAGWIGLLGLIPLAVGIMRLFAGSGRPRASVASNVAAIAGVTIANGGDNIGAWAPLLASSTRIEILLLVATFLVLTGAWCILARALVNAPTAGRWIRRGGSRLLPWVLIGLGVYILVEHHAWRLVF